MKCIFKCLKNECGEGTKNGRKEVWVKRRWHGMERRNELHIDMELFIMISANYGQLDGEPRGSQLVVAGGLESPSNCCINSSLLLGLW